MTIANCLSGLRLLIAPLLLWLAWQGQDRIFLLLLGVAFFLDFIDGTVARAMDQVSSLGGRLDSGADFAVYTCYLIGAWWLWPETIRREYLAVLLVTGSIVIPVGVALWRFRTPSSYHTWLVKAAVGCTAISSILLFMHGPAWPFHIAAALCVVAGMEQIAITLILPGPVSDLRSLWHVLRQRDRRHK